MEDKGLEQRLQRLARPGLSAARRQAIWQAAHAKAAARPIRRVAPWGMQVLRPVLAFLVVIGCLGGAMLGSAWPGLPLYGLRRQAETSLLALLPLSAQGPWRLELLNRRIHELTWLVEARRPVPSELQQEIETGLWTLSTYPELWGLTSGQVLAYVERDRQVFLDLAMRYPALRETLHLLTVSSLARDRLWGPASE